jgi:hypothetical protein
LYATTHSSRHSDAVRNTGADGSKASSKTARSTATTRASAICIAFVCATTTPTTTDNKVFNPPRKAPDVFMHHLQNAGHDRPLPEINQVVAVNLMAVAEPNCAKLRGPVVPVGLRYSVSVVMSMLTAAVDILTNVSAVPIG